MKLESGGIDWEDIELTNLTTRASRFKGTDSLNPLYLCRQVFSLLLQFYCKSPFHPASLGFFLVFLVFLAMDDIRRLHSIKLTLEEKN